MKKRAGMRWGIVAGVAAVVMLTAGISAAEDNRLWSGQTVYVPVYSHIFLGERGRAFQLSATLSIRNTDLKQAITILSADYYDTNGTLVKRFIAKPLRLNPMGSTSVYVKESDTSGGVGANFIVRWKAQKLVNEPVCEAVMIGTQSGQGISFVSRGVVIKE